MACRLFKSRHFAKVKAPFAIVISSILIFKGYAWLLGLIIGVIFVCRFGIIRLLVNSRLIYVPFIILNTILLVIIFRLFVFEVYKIPSQSMENELFSNDLVLVSKLPYGPLLPNTLSKFPVIGAFFKETKQGSAHSAFGSRLKGFSKIRRNDIVVFTRSDNKFFVKRCLALPGEVLTINNGEVYIGEKLVKEKPTVKMEYRIWPKNLGLIILFLRKQGFVSGVNYKIICKNSCYLDLPMTTKQRQALDEIGLADSVMVRLLKGGAIQGDIAKKWTPDKLGEILIPEKGSVISLDSNNFLLFSHIINRYEGEKLSLVQGEVLLNGIPAATYSFKHDYYFLLGDNRRYSIDSRFFGVIPEDAMVGKVGFILARK